MAVSIRQHQVVLDEAASPVDASITFENPVNEGAIMVAVPGQYHKESSETLTITTPTGSYTTNVTPTDVNFEMFMRGFSDVFTAADGLTVTATASGSTDAGIAMFAAELLGSNGFDVGSSKVQDASTSCAIPATAAVTANGSLAIAVFFRVSAAEAVGTPAYSGGFVEYEKIQSALANRVEIYVATLAVNALDTPACTLSGMASARDLGGIIMVFGPGSAGPSLSVPAAQTLKYGSGRTITPITPTAGDGTIDTADLTCESGMTITVVASGSAVVTGNNTNAVNVTGTQTDVLATIASVDVNRTRDTLAIPLPWYANHNLTVLVTDDNLLTAQDTVPITWEPSAAVGTDSFWLIGTSAQVLAALNAGIGWTPDTEGAASLFMYSETSAPLTDEDEFTFTVSAAGGGTGVGTKIHVTLRRRRRS